MSITYRNDAYASVYQVIEELCTGTRLPARMTGLMFSAIDDLRRARAPQRDVRLAEKVSVVMHKMEWAVRRGDVAGQEALRAELQALGSEWLDTPICRH